MDSRGYLYVFEGPDGVGKSVLSKRLFEHLRKQGVEVLHLSFPGRDPGTLGDVVYRLHHNELGVDAAAIDSTSRQLLHVAAHIDAIERRIRPALELGTSVVLDRFWWSTLVYGRHFGADIESLKLMIELERKHWGAIRPDKLFLVVRDKPARPTEAADVHTALLREYGVVADEYGADTRVAAIETDQTEDESFRAILVALQAAR